MNAATEQTRANRVAGARKGAAVRKKLAALRADYGPNGTKRGSAPIDGDIGTILARLRSAATARAGG